MSEDNQLPHSPKDLKALVSSLVAEVLNDIERRRKAIQDANEERERLEGKHPSIIVSILMRFWFTGRLILPGKGFPSFLMIVGVLVGIGAFLFFRRPPAQIPESMVGEWRTTMPVYREAGFRITPDSLVLYTINGDSTLHKITDIELRREGRGRYYTFIYGGGDTEYLMSFLFSEVPAPSIRLRNPSDVQWTKVAPD